MQSVWSVGSGGVLAPRNSAPQHPHLVPSQAADPPPAEDGPHRAADHHAVYEPSLDQCECLLVLWPAGWRAGLLGRTAWATDVWQCPLYSLTVLVRLLSSLSLGFPI